MKTTVLFYRGYVGIHSKINIRLCWAEHRGETGGHKETCIPPLLCEGSGVSGSLVGTSKPIHIMIGAPIQGSLLYHLGFMGFRASLTKAHIYRAYKPGLLKTISLKGHRNHGLTKGTPYTLSPSPEEEKQITTPECTVLLIWLLVWGRP